jgi:hypothetical protein
MKITAKAIQKTEVFLWFFWGVGTLWGKKKHGKNEP